MRNSADRILTTHVGSLPRPQALIEAIVAEDRGVAIEDLAAGLGSFAVRRALGAAWRLGPVIADDPSVASLRAAATVAGWHCLERPVGSLFCLDLVALREGGNWPSTKGKQKDRWRIRQLEKSGPVSITPYTGTDWTDATRDAIARAATSRETSARRSAADRSPSRTRTGSGARRRTAR